jgi:hypothetical protein
MNDKKHIDRLFQEGFKDFEATPSDAVWENIEAQLNQKKKKRRIVIPIWWRYAGIAALLLLLLTIGGVVFNNSNEAPTNQVVETEDVTPIKLNTEYNTILNDSNKKKSTESDIVITDVNSENKSLEENEASQPKTDNASNNFTSPNNTTIASSVSTKNENRSERDKVDSASNKEANLNNPVLKTDNNSAIAINNSKENKLPANSSLIDTEKADALIKDITKNNTAITEVKKTEYESILKTETEQKELTIEDAIDKTNEIIEEENKLNRWSIAPNAAPVYFNSLGKGSSIDPQFNNNAKSGEVNMSYGIKASYAINKKLSIRSGINRVNLGYNTNNVIAFQSVRLSSSSLLQNVNTNNNSADEAMLFISGESISSSKSESLTKTSITSLNQDMGYIEVPLEIQYTLLNKKFGINVIGGFSSLFLNKNKIYSNFNGERTLLGEANNINKVSYSANFGLGFNYKISKKLDLNLEPMFKYQINTFNNTSGDFKPFFIGVYTGFAIKF